MTKKPPRNRKPPSVGVLAKYAQAYARQVGISEGRVRSWISYMALAGALAQASQQDQPRFIVKGGVALELRLRDRARATKDIDIVLRDRDGDLVRTLENDLTDKSYQDFTFRRKREPLLLDNGAVNLEFAVSYRSGTWASISIDIARVEPGEMGIEWVPAIPLTDLFGITGPANLPCLPLRLHVAQKIHGMTLPPKPGKRNERFRDLIDLLLLEQLVMDYSGLRQACEEVFRNRATHTWPPTLEAPPHWSEPFARMARELELPVKNVGEGINQLQAFIDRINRD